MSQSGNAAEVAGEGKTFAGWRKAEVGMRHGKAAAASKRTMFEALASMAPG